MEAQAHSWPLQVSSTLDRTSGVVSVGVAFSDKRHIVRERDSFTVDIDGGKNIEYG